MHPICAPALLAAIPEAGVNLLIGAALVLGACLSRARKRAQ
jgi:hypothetical protein